MWSMPIWPSGLEVGQFARSSHRGPPCRVHAGPPGGARAHSGGAHDAGPRDRPDADRRGLRAHGRRHRDPGAEAHPALRFHVLAVHTHGVQPLQRGRVRLAAPSAGSRPAADSGAAGPAASQVRSIGRLQKTVLPVGTPDAVKPTTETVNRAAPKAAGTVSGAAKQTTGTVDRAAQQVTGGGPVGGVVHQAAGAVGGARDAATGAVSGAADAATGAAQHAGDAATGALGSITGG